MLVSRQFFCRLFSPALFFLPCVFYAFVFIRAFPLVNLSRRSETHTIRNSAFFWGVLWGNSLSRERGSLPPSPSYESPFLLPAFLSTFAPFFFSLLSILSSRAPLFCFSLSTLFPPFPRIFSPFLSLLFPRAIVAEIGVLTHSNSRKSRPMKLDPQFKVCCVVVVAAAFETVSRRLLFLSLSLFFFF